LTRLVPDQAHHAKRLSELGGAEEEAAAEILPEFETVPQPAFAEPAAITESQVESASQTPESAGEVEFEWNSVPDMAALRIEPTGELEIERGFTFETVVAEELPSPTPEMADDNSEISVTAVDDGEHSRKQAMRNQELESVDFYIAQGYLDIALDTLELLERQFGPHADIDIRRQQLQEPAAAAPPQTTLAIETVAEDNAAAFESEFDFAPAEAVVSSEVESAPQQVTPPVNAPANAPSPQSLDAGLAEVFEEYRVSAESEVDASRNGDYETHYNLGLAYQEMDLFEEALEEFQTAANLVTPGDGTPRYLQCCNLLGHCFMQKGVPQLAVTWFNKGLNAPGASDDERQALRFELGAAYEQVGDLARAIEIFTEVYGINVSYRGVNERLRELQARASGNGKVAPGSKRNQDHTQHVH
jgi:tetratricopeptide (TPR) repeat protein